MKNITQFIYILFAVLFYVSCEKDNVVVHYPKSYPSMLKAKVAESAIMYDDSISLSVEVSDQVAPLSTLEIQIVINNSLITSESVRTKGNNAVVERKYGIPFGPNKPENAEVKVYLSAINVEGNQTDTIIHSTIAHRPEISELWIVPTVGKSFKLSLTDTANLIYSTKEMDFGTTITFRIASKVDKFKKVDWSGLVFGKVNDGIGLIDQTGDAISITDASLVGISEFYFDALKFEAKVGGKLLEPFTAVNINTDLAPIVLDGKNFRGGNIYFGEGVEVTFTGLTDLNNDLSPDYFQVTGANTAKFLGKTGLYKAYYLIDANYLYIEPQPEVIYPEALWICGTGFGRPSAPYVTTASWNWNSPLDYAPCRLVSEGIYQVTIYVKNEDDGKGFGTLDFKFFHKRGWWDGHEEDASKYTVQTPVYGLNVAGKMGNVNGMTTPFEGVYRFTLNMNNKTISSEKLK